jgi:hypothetical protein
MRNKAGKEILDSKKRETRKIACWRSFYGAEDAGYCLGEIFSLFSSNSSLLGGVAHFENL